MLRLRVPAPDIRFDLAKIGMGFVLAVLTGLTFAISNQLWVTVPPEEYAPGSPAGAGLTLPLDGEH